MKAGLITQRIRAFLSAISAHTAPEIGSPIELWALARHAEAASTRAVTRSMTPALPLQA
jgi:hypothetical protein